MDEPMEGVNCHFDVGSIEVDFFVQGRLFLEYHPHHKLYKPNETKDSYYTYRRKILDRNGFTEVPLVVIEHLSELEEACKTLIQSNQKSGV